MDPLLQQVVEKLEHLPPDRLIEVEDFIDFLQQRDTDRLVLRHFAQASESTFSAVWDNDEDAIYDKL